MADVLDQLMKDILKSVQCRSATEHLESMNKMQVYRWEDENDPGGET